MSEKAETEKHNIPTKTNQLDDDSFIGEVGLLEAPNGGFAAWIVVFGCFCVVKYARFGMNFTWGTFLRTYNEHVFIGQLSSLSWIGSIYTSFMFISGPIFEWVVRKIGYRYMLVCSTILCSLSLMLASISSQIWHLYLTQGVVFGLGSTLGWIPTINLIQEWFSTRRGTALGIVMGGSGLGGIILINIYQAIISSSLGYRWALRIGGFICLFVMSLATLLIREVPDKHTQTIKRSKDIITTQKQLLKNKQFLLIMLAAFLGYFGLMVPTTLLPSYATSLKLNPWVGANLSAMVAVTSAVGKFTIGPLGDYVGRFNNLCFWTIFTGVLTLSMWINAKTEPVVWVYAILYGYGGAGFLVMLPACIPQIVGYENITIATGMFYFPCFFGFLFGSPIATILINLKSPPDYTYAALWTGILLVLSGVVSLILRIQRAGFNPCIKV
ncbi:MFS general substrate transporter [Backusella circina FSU 941]|nr:MFS general substrate transporter [Backusella circina FSU 941]